jgi:hypothetical protein
MLVDNVWFLSNAVSYLQPRVALLGTFKPSIT